MGNTGSASPSGTAGDDVLPDGALPDDALPEPEGALPEGVLPEAEDELGMGKPEEDEAPEFPRCLARLRDDTLYVARTGPCERLGALAEILRSGGRHL